MSEPLRSDLRGFRIPRRPAKSTALPQHHRVTAILLGLFAACACTSALAATPNVVVILADDLGSGDVNALNSESKIPTPNLDRLAASGFTFRHAYSPSSVCTPTRYGLLTGRYCWRSRLKSGVLDGYGEPLIEPDRMTIARFLQKHGYHTAIVGKWHLGLSFQPSNTPGAIDFTLPVNGTPITRGFDESFIIPASLDFPPYVFIRNDRVTDPAVVAQPAQDFPSFLREGPRAPDLVMENCLNRLTKEATRVIESRAKDDAPFFLYFPLTAPHKPVLPHPDFRGKTNLGPYGDFVAQVDATVGRVLDAIDDAGIADDTIVIFTSDNGSFMYRRDTTPDHVEDETVQAYRPEHHTANGIFRGTKADIWEAGHRVPFIVRWPAGIGAARSGSTRGETICLTDIFATLADILDVSIDDGAAEDSHSFLPLLQDTGGYERPAVIHHSAQGMFAVRSGPWKLVLGNGSGGREQPRGEPFARPYQLFDLSDPSERHNVIDANPDVARRLEQEFRAIYK